MEDFLSKLNPQQREAVVHLDSPQLIIAGAGSGKTRVLVYKIIYLLAKGYSPGRILALTFTNKAAREMKERIAAEMGESLAQRLWMGTFHSMFLRILHFNCDKIGYKSGFTIYDAADSKALIKSIIKQMDLDDKIYNPGAVQNAISMAKNRLLSPSDYASDRDLRELDARSKKPLIYAIYQAYQNRCVIANAMDFDDILFYTFRLFKENEDVRNHYREFFQYVLVDEYQDTNYAQHQIIKQLTEGQSNLSVVGDDAQSIYSFRGAVIANILNLKNHYPNLKIFKLERNYRSTKTIIEAANSLIAKNTRQIKKEIFSENEKGLPIQIIKSYSDFEEGYLIANKISQNKMLEHDTFSDYAILYRTNAQSRVLEESLRKRNIPYRIYGGLSFYNRKEIKDAVAYFKLVVNPGDEEAIKRVINYPARGIGDTTVNKLLRAALDKNVSVWEILKDANLATLDINAGMRRKLEGFRLLIEGFVKINEEGEDAYTLARTIINKTMLLSSLMTDKTPESISKQENINELLNGAREFVETQGEENDVSDVSLDAFLRNISLATDLDEENEGKTDYVSLMTVHASKGLEFKNVMIVGAEEDLFPSALSSGSVEELEEERRLMYVALTRAKKMCVISFAESRYRNGQQIQCKPSRFLGEIDQSFLKGAEYLPTRFTNPVRNYRNSLQGGNNNTSWNGSSSAFNRWQSSFHVPEKKTSQVSQPTVNTVMRTYTLNEIKIGQRIRHPRHGEGTVLRKEDFDNNEKIIVKFENGDVKTVILKFARFKLL